MGSEGNVLVADEEVVVQAPHPNDSIEPEGEEPTPETAEATKEETQAEETAAAEGEETEEETPSEPEKKAKVDEVPEPDSEILTKLEKLEKRLGFEQRQREKLERQLRDRRGQVPVETEDKGAPKIDDFDSREAYEEAVIDYRVEQKIRDYQNRQESEYSRRSLQSFRDMTIEAGRERYSDFDAVALAETIPITVPMMENLQECENPESVVYYLGKHVTEATAISRMSKLQQARALGIIEAKVADELRKQPKVAVRERKIVSQAPPPVKPTGSAQVVTKDPEKMTQAEYEAWRAAGGGR